MKDRGPMRGVFERPDGSGVWWINYYDAEGKRHRERIGRYNIAVEAYLQRRQEVREGRFVKPRSGTGVSFAELAELAISSKKQRNAVATSENDHYYQNCLTKKGDRIPPLLDWTRPAASISAGVVDEILKTLRERGRTGPTANRY